jgi:bacillithiol biosynthesis cysteine-adding enzyme BshC
MTLEKHPLSWSVLPGTDAFTLSYLEGDPEVHRLFVGAPWNEAAVRARLAEVTARETPHREVADALLKLYPEAAHPRMRAEIRSIRDGAPVVITGQQPGLFGGPAFTLYKFLTTRALADYWSDRARVHIVPAFWIGSEDSDLREMGWTALPDRSGGIWQDQIAIGDSDLTVPAYLHRLDARDRARLYEGLEAHLPNADLRARLRDAYSADTLCEAFICLYGRWAEALGIVLVPSHLPELRRLALPLYERELEGVGVTSQLVNAAGARFRTFHMKPPIHKSPTHLNFYWLHDNRRQPVAFHNGRVTVGDQQFIPAEFRAAMETDPARIASGVVLRPIVQDFLFRTLFLVAGPSEIVYLPQLRDSYAHFGVPFPLVAPRFSATVLTGKFARQAERFGLTPADLFASEGEIWHNAVSENRIAKTIAKWEQAEPRLRDLLAEIHRAAQEVNPALATDINAWAKEFLRQNYVFREALRKGFREHEPGLKDQVRRLCEFLRPHGKPQERVFGGIYFYAVEGEALFHAPRSLAPDDFRHHWLLKPSKR